MRVTCPLESAGEELSPSYCHVDNEAPATLKALAAGFAAQWPPDEARGKLLLSPRCRLRRDGTVQDEVLDFADPEIRDAW